MFQNFESFSYFLRKIKGRQLEKMNCRSEFHDSCCINGHSLRNVFRDQYSDNIVGRKNEFRSNDLFHQYAQHHRSEEYCRLLLSPKDLILSSEDGRRWDKDMKTNLTLCSQKTFLIISVIFITKEKNFTQLWTSLLIILGGRLGRRLIEFWYHCFEDFYLQAVIHFEDYRVGKEIKIY